MSISILVEPAANGFRATTGGPLDSTYVPGLEMYYHATRFNNLGYAAAIGVVLLVVIMVFTVLLNKFLRPAAEYQA